MSYTDEMNSARCAGVDPEPVVEVGSTISVQFDGGRPETFIVVEGDEVVTRCSPLGSAVLGKPVGHGEVIELVSGGKTFIQVLGIK